MKTTTKQKATSCAFQIKTNLSAIEKRKNQEIEKQNKIDMNLISSI